MITVNHLTKRYGDFTAVDDISFTARPGSVTGFLGPNGAGKSTAMRMMTGLTPPTSGEAHVLGRRYADLPNPGRHVGVMLDASAQHPGRTGREVLTLAARTIGVDATAVARGLATVGLTDEEAGRRVRNYSLGMRQRLGLAAALVGDPEVLVLDEPANGLDPQGIHWMRGLLRDFADAGGTVLLSSHLLSEVQIIADELVIIGNGRIVAEGTTTQLLEQQGTRVRSLDDDALEVALRAANIDVARTPAGLVAQAPAAAVGRVALDARIVLTDLAAGSAGGLEELFLTLTAADSREGIAA
ncbi:ATP-binding cassette domain-containing protein [Janibacter indicus]|uniref:ABC transporter n=1 Tax=Janibacter indicus TaxID=857417 RepID=A0A1L3MGT9_9MICO|nr:ATP-binding cassette domain-containing protein [Janibacter indicus]APH01617.1 ABC transporter [Janibacter indicus]QOK21528.1 ATP-binding cassette domain-containing protein [Janibacter indicus]